MATLALFISSGAPPAHAATRFETHTAFTNNPWAYDDAFIDVITRALVTGRSGTTYEQAVGRKGLEPGRSAGFYRPCHAASLGIAFLADPGICRVAKYTDDGKSCANRDGCGRLQFDPALLNNPAARSVVERAISTPCEVLSLPDPRADGRAASARANFRYRGLAYSARESWELFRCGVRSPVRGRVTGEDAAAGTVNFSFQ